MTQLLNTPVRITSGATGQTSPLVIETAAPVAAIFDVTVDSGQQRSSVASLGNHRMHGFIIPATITATAVRFECSLDGTTFFPIRQADNSLLSVTVATGEASVYPVDPVKFIVWPYVRLFLNVAEAASRTYQIYAGRL
jgi:hypothetical protein